MHEKSQPAYRQGRANATGSRGAGSSSVSRLHGGDLNTAEGSRIYGPVVMAAISWVQCVAQLGLLGGSVSLMFLRLRQGIVFPESTESGRLGTEKGFDHSPMLSVMLLHMHVHRYTRLHT